MKEAEVWEGIEKEKARQRMLSGGYPMDNVPQGGETRDIVAEKIGLGSGETS